MARADLIQKVHDSVSNANERLQSKKKELEAAKEILHAILTSIRKSLPDIFEKLADDTIITPSVLTNTLCNKYTKMKNNKATLDHAITVNKRKLYYEKPLIIYLKWKKPINLVGKVSFLSLVVATLFVIYNSPQEETRLQTNPQAQREPTVLLQDQVKYFISPVIGSYVLRPAVDDVLKRSLSQPGVVIIVGEQHVGKTSAILHSVCDRKGVIRVLVNEDATGSSLMKAIGSTDVNGSK